MYLIASGIKKCKFGISKAIVTYINEQSELSVTEGHIWNLWKLHFNIAKTIIFIFDIHNWSTITEKVSAHVACVKITSENPWHGKH